MNNLSKAIKDEIKLILEKSVASRRPFRIFFDEYIRSKNYNSKLRRDVGDFAFKAVRYCRAFLQGAEILEVETDIHSRSLIPSDFINIFGAEEYIADEIMYSLDGIDDFKMYLNRAPTTIRCNNIKSSVEALKSEIGKICDIRKTFLSPFGLTTYEHVNMRSINGYQHGNFEIQDEGSQLSVMLLNAKPKEKILDICAGTGGKSLALCSMLFNSAEIDAYDEDQGRINILKKRGRIASAKIRTPNKLREGYYDKILVDAPCSGLGTLRRDTDILLRLDKEKLDSVLSVQRDIFDRSIKLLKRGGRIAYVTCSILKRENESQVEYFLDKYKGLKLINSARIFHPSVSEALNIDQFYKTSPKLFGMDGFFGAVFEAE